MVRVRQSNSVVNVRVQPSQPSQTYLNINMHDSTDYLAAGIAKDWAVKTDGMVENVDYSSKYYAQKAKSYAEIFIVEQSFDSTSPNAQSGIAISGALTGKQNTLVSGTNIKTINSTSLLGSGDFVLQETLVSGTNIKTINNNSLLGNGDITVQEALVSGTNIKTINNNSLLGTGNIDILSRNIGEIVSSSIPMTDAGLHLLDGALITSGTYADFVTYMASLTATAPTVFTTEASWQAEVSATGYCDKYVYDSVNNTIRLPKYGSQLVNNIPSTLGVKGNGMAIGLTDGTNFDGMIYNSGLSSRPGVYSSPVATSGATGSSSFASNSILGVTTDSTKSGILTETNNLNKANVYYYVVIATSVKTDIQVDIDDIATDLNGKADVSMANLSSAGNAKVAELGFPSSTADNITLAASGTAYTAPANGWFILSKNTNGLYEGIQMVNTTSNFVTQTFLSPVSNSVQQVCSIPAKKGEQVTVSYSAAGATDYFKFIYAIGG